MKVLLGLPALDTMSVKSAISLFNLEIPENCEVIVALAQNPTIHQAREFLATKAEKENFDYLFFVDTDIVYPKDSLYKLINHSKDIVICDYPKKLTSGKSPTTQLKSNGTVKYGGLGFSLISTKVLKSIPSPKFETPWSEEYQTYQSENYNFCSKVIAKGFDIYCDIELSKSLKHIGQKEFIADYW